MNILDVSLDPLSPEDIILQKLADPSATATYRLSFLTGTIPAVGFETYFLTVHDDPVNAKCTEFVRLVLFLVQFVVDVLICILPFYMNSIRECSWDNHWSC